MLNTDLTPKFKKRKMNWTLAFILISGLSALIAGVLQYNERLKSSEKTKALQEELLNYTRGSRIFPIVQVIVPVNTREINVNIHNPDKNIPMLNVAGLINSDPFNYGTIYPLSGITLIHRRYNDHDSLENRWVIQLYYSNTEFLMIAVQVYEIAGKFEYTINYAGRGMVDRTPQDQKRMNEDVEKRLQDMNKS